MEMGKKDPRSSLGFVNGGGCGPVTCSKECSTLRVAYAGWYQLWVAKGRNGKCSGHRFEDPYPSDSASCPSEDNYPSRKQKGIGIATALGCSVHLLHTPGGRRFDPDHCRPTRIPDSIWMSTTVMEVMNPAATISLCMYLYVYTYT